MSKTIGLIGCGRWGKNIFRDLSMLHADVIVVDPVEKIRLDVLNEGAKAAYSQITDVLKEVHGFVVATSTVTHAEVVEQLLPFDKPIFVEKPLTCDIHSARRLAQIGKGKIFVMDKWRYHAGINMLAKKTQSGELGRLQTVRSFRLGWGHFHDDVDPLWILLPHDLSIIFHLLGEIPPLKSVTSLVATDPASWIIITLEGENTTKVMIEMSTLHPISRRSVIVRGQEGSIQLGDANDDHVVLCKNDVCDNISIEPTLPLFLELQTFLNYLDGGPEPNSSLQEGILIVEKIAEIRQHLALH